MKSYWGVEHGEEISKLGSAKVDHRSAAYANVTTGVNIQKPARGVYRYQGKSLILRRPKYQAYSHPGPASAAAKRLGEEGNLGLRVRRHRWSKDERNALHEAASSGKNYKRKSITYKKHKEQS